MRAQSFSVAKLASKLGVDACLVVLAERLRLVR